MTALLERLGRSVDDRIVILTLDGLGSSNASNNAIGAALAPHAGRQPLASSVALQVPCPWARGGAQVVRENAGVALGVELTLNCAPATYRWSSLTKSPSLGDGDGGLPRTVEDLLEHADTPELLRECRAQIGRAVDWGLTPMFLTSHLDALAYRPEFFDILLEVALEHRLPVRLPDPTVDLGFDARHLAGVEGVLTPDHVVQSRPGRDVRTDATDVLRSLSPGVTEIVVRPAIDSPELRAITPYWAARIGDGHMVTRDWHFRSLLHQSGASLANWKEIYDAQAEVAQ